MTDSELDADEARQRLYETMKLDLPFEEKAEKVLAIGEAYLRVDSGYITRIDEENDYWKVVASSDSEDGAHPPGLRLDLGTTFCRRTIAEDGSIALHDAPNQGWEDDVAFQEYGLRCYHGSTLEVDGELYGTVCFSSTTLRGEPFSDEETTFAELIARLLEHELQRQRTAATIDRLDRFASAVSHDLRNPLNIAAGRVDIEREQRDSENLRIAAEALDRMDDLITDVLTMARQGEDVGDLEDVTLASLASGCWEAVQSPGAHLRIDGDLTFRADKGRARQLLVNLFRNSVEHGAAGGRTEADGSGGDGAGVTITVGPLADGDGFFIEDDGPGIPASERENVLKPGYSTDGEGLGLGLAIVESIASAHGWHLTITDAESGGARFEIHDVITSE